MKTTIKTSETQAVAVETHGYQVRMTILNLRKPVATVTVDNITTGALLWAIEQAAQAAQVAEERNRPPQPASEPHGY